MEDFVFKVVDYFLLCFFYIYSDRLFFFFHSAYYVSTVPHLLGLHYSDPSYGSQQQAR